MAQFDNEVVHVWDKLCRLDKTDVEDIDPTDLEYSSAELVGSCGEKEASSE